MSCSVPFLSAVLEGSEDAQSGAGAPAPHPGIDLRIPQRHLLPLGKLQPAIMLINSLRICLLGFLIIIFIFNHCKGGDSWGKQEQNLSGSKAAGSDFPALGLDLSALQ